MDKNRPIYLDYHSTTPVREEVFEAMKPFFCERFGNPASRTHEFGLEAKTAVDQSRELLVSCIGARSDNEIVFVSGATEANNLALRGIVAAMTAVGKTHIVTTAVEHKAVLDTCAVLERDHAFTVTYLPVRSDGTLDLHSLQAALSSKTGLVSVMAANNEVGTINPIAKIGELAKQCGAVFHVDAAQAFGKVPIDVEAMGIHLLSLSAHKLYGPKGIGALYVRRRHPRIELRPILTGGGHESGLRSGTLSTPLIVGFAEAAKYATREMSKENIRLAALRDRLLKGLQDACPGLMINGTLETRLPNNLNVSFPGVDSEALMLSLREGVAVSNGSACTAADWKSSYVLRAMGCAESRARGAIRFSVGRPTTSKEIERTIALFAETVPALQALGTKRSSQPEELTVPASEFDRS